jgi:hypothetical protein
MDLTTAATASRIIADALKALNAVRERAKTSKDSQLKDQIAVLYDNLLSAKEAVLRLTEENSDLKRRLEEKDSLRRDPKSGLIYVGDPSPLCPKCYQMDKKSVHLDPPYTNPMSGTVSRYCRVCHEEYW